MVDEDQAEGLERTAPPTFAGMLRYLKGRLGRPVPPRHDPTKMPVEFRPLYRVVIWDGAPTDHLTAECEVLMCSKTGQFGEHTEVRPNGFVWEGALFHSLFEALENQAFRQWYESGGQEIVERNELTVHDPQYADNEGTPLPRFNFFLHENIEKMSTEEILVYKRSGEVPKRLRRRARGRNESSS